ncbi:hypothetical protein VT84_25675 [Gemmata sp. SH-PL17]|uniref:hypothetical protein n=1 Tax=Gemmata sp. SH-PL17 TaxID=1630693 RepID=UPI000697503A|nr:hypothetical protein [Gemmata sp. SH-PL17]AMV27818.1 hypothetical protein VT84_25675 [Gemmata sp. SH-PL17]
MLRALSILVALTMLTPQGVCLRKFDHLGWLFRAPATTSIASQTRADEQHAPSCKCGCRERADRDREVADCGTDSVDLRVRDGAPPLSQEPCCPTLCKSKLDKIAHAEPSQPSEEAVAFVGFAPAPVTATFESLPHRFSPLTHTRPPLYVSFCTFLI